MTGALLHFESGVPICDLDIRHQHKERLMRVAHVYRIWLKNPYIDVFALLKQMAKEGKVKKDGTEEPYADIYSEWRVAQKDKLLFDFVKERVTIGSRREDELKVRLAAEQAIKIGMETDNPNALTKGGKLLYDVAGLDKPESEQADLSKAHFIQPVVTTVASEVDPSKIDYSDEQSLLIMREFGAYIDPKRESIENKVAAMEAKAKATETKETDETEEQ